MSPGEIRQPSLPKSLRGFEETATRKFLGDVADAVQRLTAERDKLRRQLEEVATGADPENPTAIGNALLAAQRAGEELVAHANETAARITAEARSEAERLLEQARQSAAGLERQLDERRHDLDVGHERLRQEMNEWQTKIDSERSAAIAAARAEADELTAHSQQRLEALRREGEELRLFIEERHGQFVDMLQSALDQVGQLHELASEGPPGLAEILESRLPADAREQREVTYLRPDETPPEGGPHGLRLTETAETNPAPAEPSGDAPATPQA